MLRVTAESALYASQNGYSIVALALSNQRETAAAWDAATGTAVSNAISLAMSAVREDLQSPLAPCRFDSCHNRPSSGDADQRWKMGVADGERLQRGVGNASTQYHATVLRNGWLR